jgi:hypothetical protein
MVPGCSFKTNKLILSLEMREAFHLPLGDASKFKGLRQRDPFLFLHCLHISAYPQEIFWIKTSQTYDKCTII